MARASANILDTFTVTWTGDFPFDMLRYDHCWPKHETDSGVLERSTRPRERGPWTIELECYRAPTRARWESFGCRVMH